MSQKLVIVESPAKARTLERILGKGYAIRASMGHVRDLPKSTLGVDIEHDFAPEYSVVKEKKKTIEELRKAVKAASDVFLATDPDREGEAISWHLVQATGLNKDGLPVRRVAFHEITPEAVTAAFQHPRSINMSLVNAQQARRILDRLVGYKLSPLLWRKVRKGLSAGRVQSAALKLIVDREREVTGFTSEEFWVIEAQLAKARDHEASFWATLVGLTGGGKLAVANQAEADDIAANVRAADCQVAEVKRRDVTRQPAAPFTTSTMQQEAWRKLRFTAERTMRVAQQLYEGLQVGQEGQVGLITYMRTDSTQVAASALAEARKFIADKYGARFLPPSPRHFAKRGKWAQEAHEAIRPTTVFREPAALKPYLSAEQLRLYELIWNRMVASQMAAAVLDSVVVDVSAQAKAGLEYLLRATSSTMTFPGFTALYTEGKDEDEEKTGHKFTLPSLRKGEHLEMLDVSPEQRFTQPPPRYTEATLVKALEQKGIGRPSTYASIISVVQQRDYVNKVQGRFHALELGTLVNGMLERHFPVVVDLSFTAHMEEDLDGIARGEKEWVSVLREFYTPFEAALREAQEKAERVKFKEEETGEACPECGKPMVVKMGRFGKFVACTGYPECRTTRPYLVKVGVPCPECSGDLIERVSKKKRTFYGCANYPRCKFITGRRPLATPCPKCKGLLTSWGKGKAKCVKCGYTGPAPGQPAEDEGALEPVLAGAGRRNRQ
ncbi:MAG: type I DNA topoisomerase [Chloroflexi bacterium]|nr:type I DNA topoisomerase [Chloroflexota bacterium]